MAYTNVAVGFAILLVGALAVCLTRTWRSAGWTATAFVAAAAGFCWIDSLRVILGSASVNEEIARLPGFGSTLAVSLDSLGAGFLMLITGVCLIATFYSIGYMGIYLHDKPRRFYSLLMLFIAGMIGVVSVHDWLFFIVFWELMTLASYFLVTFERSDPAAVRAGFKYFVMTHVASAGLLVAAIVLWRVTGSFAFDAHSAGLGDVSAGLKNLLLALYLLAFATKAGIFPMGDWLPDAHPAAPSGVSAILSGVMIKLGAYGVLRVFFGMNRGVCTETEIVTWGVIIAALGVVSAFVGGVTAMRENDAKRLLAFSSISQTGYIFLALGISFTLSATPALMPLALLALVGALFHILNDAIYKSLLFMNAGSVLYSAGTRDLNRVGGLSAVMPIVSATALIGVLSVSGLPPTNGFASKWIIYQSAIGGGLQYAPFIAAAVVAFFVSLSTLAYSVKFYGTAFLGTPAAAVDQPRPVPRTMGIAQGACALACIVIGLAPVWAVRAVDAVIGEPRPGLFAVTRIGALSAAPDGGLLPAVWSPILLVAALVVCFVIAEVVRSAGRAPVRAVPSWYCGEEHPSDEVRFRARGLYSPFNEVFAKVYPHVPVPRLPSIKKLRELLDLDRWLYNPLVKAGGRAVDKVSRSHVGTPQLYMVWQIGGMAIVLMVLFLVVR